MSSATTGMGNLVIWAAVASAACLAEVSSCRSLRVARQVMVLSLFPRPARDHYFPDLHHLKFELEEGTTPAGRAVRFGYNPLEFEGFSWRGYAQMSSIQVHLGAAAQPSSPWGGLMCFWHTSFTPSAPETPKVTGWPT